MKMGERTRSKRKPQKVPLPQRPRRLYWLEGTKTRIDELIFDPGYSGGDVHLYSHVETRPAADIRHEMLKALKLKELDPSLEPDVVGMWARRRGANVEWSVGPP